MRHFDRAFVWTGGAVFVASLAYTAWWYVAPRAPGMIFAGWLPVITDALLFTLFAAHHSLLARPSMKTAVSRLVPDRLLRSTYVWTASILLILVCRLWQPIGGDLYQIGGWPAAINIAAQLAGVLIIALSVKAIDPLELAGIRHAGRDTDLQARGPYRLVRHPVYLGWMVIVFAAAHMTGDRLTFAATSSIYLVIAIPWEERSLAETFGERYERYKRAVRWRVVPYVY
jgi:protein-S-isoprenylcysteine O-methyltransferase Ste14